MTDETDIVGRIERLRLDPSASMPSFQGVLAAVSGLLEGVRTVESHAAASAISLAQRESIGALVNETESTIGSLKSLAARPAPTVGPSRAGAASSWWYALAEATQTIDSTIDRISYIVAAQPKGSAVRLLVTEVLRVLRGHQRLLMGEATRWIDG